MKLLAVITGFSLVVLTSGCGKKDAAEAVQNLLVDSSGDVATNVLALAETQSDTLDEVATALNESGSGGSASALTDLGLAAPVNGTHALGTRSCVANTDDGKVTVTINFDKSKTDRAEKAGRVAAAAKVSSSVTGEGKLTRVWTLPADRKAEAACTASGHFKFKNKGKTGADVAGLKLEEAEERSRTMSVTKAGKTLTGRTMATAGARTVEFAASTDASATYQKTVTTNVTRTMTITKPNGEKLSREKKMSTENPLVIQIKRDDNGELQTKTVTSGKLKAETSTEKLVVTTTFSNVKYEFSSSNDNKCTPVSGTISGETIKDGVTQKSYTIDFGADTTKFPSGISIKLGDADAIDCETCVVAKCDLE